MTAFAVFLGYLAAMLVVHKMKQRRGQHEFTWDCTYAHCRFQVSSNDKPTTEKLAHHHLEVIHDAS